MDAVRFLEERYRMCIEHHKCGGCPASIDSTECKVKGIKIDAKEAVRVVEQWSKEYPRMTNRQKFKEVFGIDAADTALDTFHSAWLDKEYKEPEGD